MVRQPLLWLSVEKPKLVLCFTTYCKIVRVNRRSYSDSLHQKSLISDYICRTYLNISQGSGFFRHSVYEYTVECGPGRGCAQLL